MAKKVTPTAEDAQASKIELAAQTGSQTANIPASEDNSSSLHNQPKSPNKKPLANGIAQFIEDRKAIAELGEQWKGCGTLLSVFVGAAAVVVSAYFSSSSISILSSRLDLERQRQEQKDTDELHVQAAQIFEDLDRSEGRYQNLEVYTLRLPGDEKWRFQISIRVNEKGTPFFVRVYRDSPSI